MAKSLAEWPTVQDQFGELCKGVVERKPKVPSPAPLVRAVECDLRLAVQTLLATRGPCDQEGLHGA
eukprot:6670486-Pyramimonas_sp.AAC.1